MIVVLDTNILVSAMLDTESSCGRILELALDGALSAAYSPDMYVEYQDVLRRRKFSRVHPQAEIILERIAKDWIQVSSVRLLIPLPDPKDQPFLETALAIRADALITGNLRHFPPPARQAMTILSPAEFISRLYRA